MSLAEIPDVHINWLDEFHLGGSIQRTTAFVVLINGRRDQSTGVAMLIDVPDMEICPQTLLEHTPRFDCRGIISIIGGQSKQDLVA